MRTHGPGASTDPLVSVGSDSILEAEAARELLLDARRIAVVGASPDPWRASHSVMAYLLGAGYECVPVNPTVERVLGQPTFPSLEAAVAAGGLAFDIVDVFRRPAFAPDIARSAVALGCRALWLQLGVISPEAVRIASEGGLAVVMDRCTAVDHRALRDSGRLRASGLKAEGVGARGCRAA